MPAETAATKFHDACRLLVLRKPINQNPTAITANKVARSCPELITSQDTITSPTGHRRRDFAR